LGAVVGAKFVGLVHGRRLPVGVVIHQGCEGACIQPAGLNRRVGLFLHRSGSNHDIAAADRFIRNNPGNPHLDYAYYLKGLVNYNLGADFIDRVAGREPSERDTRALRDAFNDFTQLVKQFPNSRYAEDSKQRLVFLHNQLAQYEINVANYYMRRGAYVAAANRAKYVVENYQRTPAAKEALKVLVEAYSEMGMDDLADDAQRVLDVNVPVSDQNRNPQ